MINSKINANSKICFNMRRFCQQKKYSGLQILSAALTMTLPAILAFAIGVFWTSAAPCESAVQIKKSEQEVRDQMIKISTELGVTCTECHMIDNFNDSSKESYRVALQHMKIVQAIKENGFNGQKGQPESNCFLCHRGELKFNHKASKTEK